MGLFGQLDAEKIKTNPFFVEAGIYSGQVTDAGFKTKNDGQRFLFIEMTIEDETAFNGQKVSKRFNLADDSLDEETIALLPADEQRKINQTNASIKRTLCGTEGVENQRGLGIDPEDLNDPNWDPKVMKGSVVDFEVNNFGAGNQGVGVKWINLSE